MKWYFADTRRPDNGVPILLARWVGQKIWDLGVYRKSQDAYFTVPEDTQIDPLLWAYVPQPHDGDEVVGVDQTFPPQLYTHQYQAVLHRIGSESVNRTLTDWMDGEAIVSDSVQTELRRIAEENPMSIIKYSERYILNIQEEEQGYVHERHHH